MREATEQDLDKIVTLGKVFFQETQYSKIGTEYDFDTIMSTCKKMITEPSGVIFVEEDTQSGALLGMAACMTYTLYLNARHLTGSELFWYVIPVARHNGIGHKLLEGIENWARNKGCDSLSMVTLRPGDPAAKLYERAGYTLSEVHYLKGLK